MRPRSLTICLLLLIAALAGSSAIAQDDDQAAAPTSMEDALGAILRRLERKEPQ